MALSRVSTKYHLIGSQAVSSQQERKRLAALEKGDQNAYAVAFFETEQRKLEMGMLIEETIFDHFEISPMQLEASRHMLKRDMDW